MGTSLNILLESMSPGYNRRNLRGEVVWEFEMLVNGQQVNVKISNDTGKITEIDR